MVNSSAVASLSVPCHQMPGTCCHWKGNFGRVIPLLEKNFRVLCVSYDGFDETENTEFPTMPEETEKIEAYEMDEKTPHNVIDIMEEQKAITNMGGTMRLGALSLIPILKVSCPFANITNE